MPLLQFPQFFSSSSLKSAPYSVVSFRDYYSPCFSFRIIIQQNRYISANPRFDFGRKRDPNDAIDFCRELVRTLDPSPSLVDFTRLLSSVVQIEQYSPALYLFDEMLHRSAPVVIYTSAIAIDCFCRLKRGYESDVVDFTNLVKGIFMVRKVSDSGNLYNKLLKQKLCEPNEVTYELSSSSLHRLISA